jgi:glycine/D-amino acid oxidase-like deaminating enzyme
MSYSSSFWEKTSFLESCDLIVVGAGIVGLSSALFYKQANPDSRVLVIERGFLPQGASTRNAGFACVGSVGEHLADMEKESEQNIKERIKRRYNGLELLKSTLGEEAIGYKHCGGYEFFASQDEFDNVAPQIDRFNSWMEELLDEETVYQRDEIAGYPVIHNRLEGALHPGKMMQTLVNKAGKAGVEIKWNSEVEHISQGGEVKIAGGPSLQAARVLVAANGFVKRILPDMDITPARGLVLVTNEQQQMPWKGIFHHDRGYIYFRNLGQRLLIGGARNLDIDGEATDQFGANQIIKDHLVDFVSNILRLSSGWEIEHEWSGIMGFTPTKTPLITQVDQHRYVAAGLSGMGIAIGMDVGQKAAEKLQ